MLIRDLEPADAPAAVDIYNEELFTTTSIWTERPQTLEDRLRQVDERRSRRFPSLVAEEAGRVIGVASFGDFRDSISKEGYRFTVEHSVHVTRGAWGRGVGRALMAALFERAERRGVHAMIAGIDASNVGSIAFHERLGFTEVARMPETGWVHGRWCDLVLLQRFLRTPGTPPV